MRLNPQCLLCFLLLIEFGCRKPYTPPAVANAPSYLVVEGTILSGPDSTIFKLSRTIKLSSAAAPKPESNAVLAVESSGNATFALTEIKPGYYAAPGQNLDTSKKYRLRITTTDHQVYLSDFVPVRITPPIDSVYYTVLANGVQFFADAHDPNNNTRYYRWDFEETWQFQAKYVSTYLFDGKQFLYRPSDQQVFYCFGDDVSTTILSATSVNLSRDVIYHMPLTFVASNSEKLEAKYSIRLRQYALTKDAYTFWTNLKKNTEQLGTIFDPSPFQNDGNIHNISNPKVPVFGYVSASTLQTKRIFVAQTQLPGTWRAVYPYTCAIDTLLTVKATGPPSLSPNQVPLLPFYQMGFLAGYTITPRECGDCTLRGFTQQPSFWQ